MLLLPLAPVKDAARAVKRICKEAFTETNDSVLTEFLGIATLTITMFCLRREGEQEVLHLQVINYRGIPFDLRLPPNKETLHAMDDIENSHNLESADTVEEMFKKIGV